MKKQEVIGVKCSPSGVWLLILARKSGLYAKKTQVNCAIENAEVIILAQVEDVHEQEESCESEKHPQAITKCYLFHNSV